MPSLEPRIYVASLSDYNNGHLLGTWIDLTGLDENDVYAAISQLLRQSRYPNVMRQDCECKSCHHTWTRDASTSPGECPECGEDEPEAIECGVPFPSAEEWAIHDFEGFGAYRVGEGEDISTLVRLAKAFEEHDGDAEAFAFFASERDIDDAERNFEEAYQGEWDSERAYAENLLDDTGDLNSIPEHLRYYFDYEAFTRDLFINDYSSERMSNGNVSVFWRYV